MNMAMIMREISVMAVTLIMMLKRTQDLMDLSKSKAILNVADQNRHLNLGEGHVPAHWK